MTQSCKVTFGNISSGVTMERVFYSKQSAFMWLIHEMTRNANFKSCHELYFRIESYNSDEHCNDKFLPF